MAVGELNEKKRNINDGKSGDTGESKGGGTKEGIKKNISGGINEGLLFKKKRFTVFFFKSVYDLDRFRRVYKT